MARSVHRESDAVELAERADARQSAHVMNRLRAD
jgi:hypothetical protein